MKLTVWHLTAVTVVGCQQPSKSRCQRLQLLLFSKLIGDLLRN
jgi:hypothetical protein